MRCAGSRSAAAARSPARRRSASTTATCATSTSSRASSASSVPIFHNDVQHAARSPARRATCSRSTATRSPRSGATGATTRARFGEFAGDEAALDAPRANRRTRLLSRAAGRLVRRLGRRRLPARSASSSAPTASTARPRPRSPRARRSGPTTCSAAARPGATRRAPTCTARYDYGAPIGESGATGARFEAVRRLNEFVVQLEADLACTDPDPEHRPRCAAALRDPARRATPLRVPAQPDPARAPASSTPGARARRARPVGDADPRLRPRHPRALVGRVARAARRRRRSRRAALPPALPRLERWRFSDASPQLGARYDDSCLDRALAAGARDRRDRPRRARPALGLRLATVAASSARWTGCCSTRATAGRCGSTAQRVASGDQLRNPLGVGADGARRTRVSLRRAPLDPAGENTIAILVESLGHNKAFADDGANPRGLVSLDTGATRVALALPRRPRARRNAARPRSSDFAGSSARSPARSCCRTAGSARPKAWPSTRRASGSRASTPSTPSSRARLRPRAAARRTST